MRELMRKALLAAALFSGPVRYGMPVPKRQMVEHGPSRVKWPGKGKRARRRARAKGLRR